MQINEQQGFTPAPSPGFMKLVLGGGLTAGVFHMVVRSEARNDFGKMRHVLASSLVGAGVIAVALVAEQLWKKSRSEKKSINAADEAPKVQVESNDVAPVRKGHVVRVMAQREQAAAESGKGI